MTRPAAAAAAVSVVVLAVLAMGAPPPVHADETRGMAWQHTEAGKAYQAAVELLHQGKAEEAEERLRAIADKYPGTLAGAFAAEMARTAASLRAQKAGGSPATTSTPAPSAAATAAETSRVAAVEATKQKAVKTVLEKRKKESERGGTIPFAIVQAGSGAYVGGAIAHGRHDSARVTSAWVLGGAGVGAGTALLWSRFARMTPGRSLILNFSTIWGSYNGLGVMVLATGQDRWFERMMVSSSIGVASTIGTAIATSFGSPSVADGALVASGAFWGSAFGALITAAANRRDERSFLGWSLLGGDVMTAGMVALARNRDISLGKVVGANIGGVGGAGFVALLAWLAGADFDKQRGLAFGVTAGGAAVGLVAGYFAGPNGDGGGGGDGDVPYTGSLVSGTVGSVAAGEGPLGHGLRVALPLPRFEAAPRGATGYGLGLLDLRF